MKVVIVHDYLNQLGGAERVVGAMHELFPDAPIYTLFVDREKLWPSLHDAHIIPSVLQRFPFIVKHFKWFFWLYPFAIRTLRIPECDVLISSSSAYAKGVRARGKRGNKPVHVCYCHTPMRFAWNFHHYIARETSNQWLAIVAGWGVGLLKRWDVATSRSVDAFIANSTTVKQRIEQFYQRDAAIIYPPVDTNRSQFMSLNPSYTDDYYLVVSRLVSYKRLDLAVEACSVTDRKLLVIGTGLDRERLEALAGPTVEFLGWQTDEEVTRYMRGCKALIFPGEEDFGITPIEVHALGKPVVAYRQGGALDTIQLGVNGVFFDQPTAKSLIEALEQLEYSTWDSAMIQQSAKRFAQKRFAAELNSFVHQVAVAPENIPSGVDRLERRGGFIQ